MKTFQPLLYANLLFAIGNLSASAVAANDAAAIAAQSRAFMQALQAGDAAAAAQLFTAEAKLRISVTGELVSGRAAIENFWRSAIDAGVRRLDLTAVDLEGDRNVRVETGTYRAFGDGAQDLGGGDYLFVWMKEGGVWRIHRDFGIQATPPAAAGPADRVGFPQGYSSSFKLLGIATKGESPEVMTTYGNAAAAGITRPDQLPFPDGAVLLMEFANAARDGEGGYLRDRNGQLLKGEIVRVDVMRRGSGFGAGYGESRAGEWEFASYNPDGTTRIPPDKAAHCAACHRKVGAEKDYVHRLRPVATALEMRPPCSAPAVAIAR